MADINLLVPKIINWEGGFKFTDDPDDAGGATVCGITFTTFKTWADEHKLPDTITDLKSISIEQFTAVLKEYFWDKWRADEINDQQVAEVLVDWLWGSGFWGIELPQIILGVHPDGVVGPATIAAVNAQDAAAFCNAVVERRIVYYQNIVEQHPQWQKFLQGWINRANSYRYKQA